MSELKAGTIILSAVYVPGKPESYKSIVAHIVREDGLTEEAEEIATGEFERDLIDAKASYPDHVESETINDYRREIEDADAAGAGGHVVDVVVDGKSGKLIRHDPVPLVEMDERGYLAEIARLQAIRNQKAVERAHASQQLGDADKNLKAMVAQAVEFYNNSKQPTLDLEEAEG